MRSTGLGLVGAALLASLALAPACKGEPGSGVAGATSAGPPASASAAPVKVLRPEDLPEELRVPTAWPIPVGPRLEIVAGQGVGAIRLGANVATIERLMEVPCEIKTEEVCRYPTRAVEFVLKDGVAVEIHAHRQGRPAGAEGQKYGIFNGRMRGNVAIGMFPFAVKEVLGPPLKVEPALPGNPASTVEVFLYDGLRVEMDKLPNGNVVVGGIVVVKGEAKGTAVPAATAPAKSKGAPAGATGKK